MKGGHTVLIRSACYYTGSNYAARTSDDLVAAILAPAALKELSLLQLFTMAVQAGAEAAEFRAIWQYQEYVRRVEEALARGDLAATRALLTVCPVPFSEKTLAALNTVIAANTLRLIDVVAAELGQNAPATVSAADVDAALGRKQATDRATN